MLNSAPKIEEPTLEIIHILALLQSGEDPAKVTRDLASRYPENRTAAHYLVDVAVACIWLSENAPTCDVLTVLESRHRFEFSSTARRVYAVQVLWAAERYTEATKALAKSASKESKNAAA